MPALEYTLGLKTSEFQNGIQKANAEANGFSKNLAAIGATGERAGRALGGGFREMREGAHGAKEGMQALTGATELLGYQVAPQATLAVRTLYESIKALQSLKNLGGGGAAGGEGAAVAGISLGSIVLGAAAAAASIATLVTGYQALKAGMEEADSVKALEHQHDFLTGRLIPDLEKYIRLGRIDFKTGRTLENNLRNARGYEQEHAAITAAQKTLRNIHQEDTRFTIGQSLDHALKVAGFGLLSDRNREKAEYSERQNGDYLAALDLAKQAGRDDKPVTDLFNRLTKAEYAKIDAKYDAMDAAKKTKPDFSGHPEMYTALQKIGFVFRGGTGSDPMQQTARHTRETVTMLKEIHQTLKQRGAASFGDDLMNPSAI